MYAQMKALVPGYIYQPIVDIASGRNHFSVLDIVRASIQEKNRCVRSRYEIGATYHV